MLYLFQYLIPHGIARVTLGLPGWLRVGVGWLVECILLTGLTVNTLCARLGSRSTQQLRTIPHELPKWTELSHSVLCQWNVTLAMSRQSFACEPHSAQPRLTHTRSLSPLLSLMSTAGGTFGNEHLSCVWVLAEPRRPIAMRSNKLRVLSWVRNMLCLRFAGRVRQTKTGLSVLRGVGNMCWQHALRNMHCAACLAAT